MSEPDPADHTPRPPVTAEVCLVEGDAGLGRALGLALAEGGAAKVEVFEHGTQALDHLRRHAADVVVASDNLTEPSCAALLRQVQHETPAVIRVVLSDQDGVELFRRVPYAHQFIRRSAPSTALRSALARCMDARGLLAREKLRSLVLASNALPATPKLYGELIDLLADPRCSLVKVVDVIQRDLSMSTRLVQLVSSAFFGLSSQMTSLGACVAYLGLNTVRSLVLSAEITRLHPVQIQGFSAEQVHARALATSRLARRLAPNVVDEWHAFVAGLLHGVGQLVLASRAPVQFQEAVELGASSGIGQRRAIEEVFGASDAHVAAFLLAIWGQPLDVVMAIANQDVPQQEGSTPGLASIIYLSKRLSQNPDVPLGSGDLGPGDTAEDELSEPFLAQMGLLEELPRYRARATPGFLSASVRHSSSSTRRSAGWRYATGPCGRRSTCGTAHPRRDEVLVSEACSRAVLHCVKKPSRTTPAPHPRCRIGTRHRLCRTDAAFGSRCAGKARLALGGDGAASSASRGVTKIVTFVPRRACKGDAPNRARVKFWRDTRHRVVRARSM